jgi:gamma-glutamyltranspeptidase / glutathione hydrolase
MKQTRGIGAVTSSHRLASAVGMSILEKGGTAADAAVAVGLTLQVVEPSQCSLGGEVVILGLLPKASRPFVLCGQGVAPAAANISHYRREGFKFMPGSGLLSAVVPGALGAWMLLLRDHGRLDLEEIFGPAIHYARHGHNLAGTTCRAISRVADLARRDWWSSARIFLPRGDVPATGSLFVNAELADTYEKLLRAGCSAKGTRGAKIQAVVDAFYQGFIAEAIGTFATAHAFLDSSGAPHKGVIDAGDLARWQPSYEEPLSFEYRGYSFFKPGPWSQGPVLLQTLALLEPFALEELDPWGDEFLHILIEALKLTYMDREGWYGDPRFVSVPIEKLLSAEYSRERRDLIHASCRNTVEPGAVDGHRPALPIYPSVAEIDGMGRTAKAVMAGRPSGDTCHLDVIDRWGGVISATPSGGWFQSSPVVPGLGFALSNRGQMFWLEEGVAASLAPGKRPRTTLSPTLALRGGETALAFGCRGGDVQDQWSAQFALRHILHGVALQTALDAPLFITDHAANSEYPRGRYPGRVSISTSYPGGTIEGLRRRGHDVRAKEPAGFVGYGQGCAAKRKNGVVTAGAATSMPEAGALVAEDSPYKAVEENAAAN